MSKLYLLFTDETNKEYLEGIRFFIYGGVIVDSDNIGSLHELVENTRCKYKFKATDEFKFASASKPGHISRGEFTAAKNDILNGCLELGVKFIVCLTLHHIARHRSVGELVSWGANTIMGKFDEFLNGENADGVCIVDRLPFGSDYSLQRSPDLTHPCS